MTFAEVPDAGSGGRRRRSCLQSGVVRWRSGSLRRCAVRSTRSQQALTRPCWERPLRRCGQSTSCARATGGTRAGSACTRSARNPSHVGSAHGPHGGGRRCSARPQLCQLRCSTSAGCGTASWWTRSGRRPVPRRPLHPATAATAVAGSGPSSLTARSASTTRPTPARTWRCSGASPAARRPRRGGSGRRRRRRSTIEPLVAASCGKDQGPIDR